MSNGNGFGGMFNLVWPVVRNMVKGVKISFDVERKVIVLTKAEQTQELSFADIEKAINES